MTFALLFGQAATDALAGGAGWAGAGLLGGVLSWLLLKHLPDKDRQIGKLVEDKDVHVKGLVDTFLVEVRTARAEASEILTREREQRHKERDQTHADNLKMAVLLEQNTQETRLLAQETRALAASIGNLILKLGRDDTIHQPHPQRGSQP